MSHNIRCPNSLNGNHKWRESVGKNAATNAKFPHIRVCVYCNRAFPKAALAAAEDKPDE